MRGRLIALILASGILLAGCVAPATDPVRTDDVEDSVIELVDAYAALDAGDATANVAILGDWRNSGGQEADAWGDYLFVDRGNQVHILDVSDPEDIQEVGVISGIPRVLDVKVSHDGNYAFIGDDDRLGISPFTDLGRSSGGIYVFDVSDKTDPKFVSYQSVGPERGPHMVYYLHTSAGEEILFGANADVSIHRFDRETGTLTELSRYRPDLVTGFNRHPEVFDVLYQGWAHDMFVMEDPVDGRLLMYVANWDAGLRVVDVSNPANPKELGHWNDFPSGHAGNLHTVATDWIGDRRITVGAVEVGFAVVGGYHYVMGTEANVVYVWDTTDATSPTLLGYWQNPIEPYAGRDYFADEELSSTHNLQLEDGRIYLAHYAMGVWILDVSTQENQADPKIVGYYHEPGMNTWDVVLNQGVVYTSGALGVLGLHFAADLLGPEGITSRA